MSAREDRARGHAASPLGHNAQHGDPGIQAQEPRHDVPVSGQLDATRLDLIARLNAQGQSLREIASEVGVSHETVRAVLRQRGSAPVPDTRGAPPTSPPRTP